MANLQSTTITGNLSTTSTVTATTGAFSKVGIANAVDAAAAVFSNGHYNIQGNLGAISNTVIIPGIFQWNTYTIDLSDPLLNNGVYIATAAVGNTGDENHAFASFIITCVGNNNVSAVNNIPNSVVSHNNAGIQMRTKNSAPGFSLFSGIGAGFLIDGYSSVMATLSWNILRLV
jgi:hypothetical protein